MSTTHKVADRDSIALTGSDLSETIERLATVTGKMTDLGIKLRWWGWGRRGARP